MTQVMPHHRNRRVFRWPLAGFASATVVLIPKIILAAPSQEEVFRSIKDNVGESTDPRKLLAFLIGAVAVIALLTVFSHWRKREAAPKALNHQGKLLKELSAAINLKQAELKQLKMLAEAQNVLSPMTLILCPSVLGKAVKQSAGKVDRQTILQIARKLR
jgi:hypothetical protein